MDGEMNGYEVSTSKVLKGDPALKNTTFIGTAESSASCKYEHPADAYGVDYVAAGRSANGTLTVVSCNYKEKWSNLTPSQKSGLEKDYKPGCGKCQIMPHGSDNTVKNTCILGDENEAKDQINKQACLPDQYSTCAWKNI